MNMLIERFLKYVSFETTSSEESNVTPSTPGQFIFANYLKDELTEIGLQEIELDGNGYLYATLPANTAQELPTIGFIAHMDTSPDMSGKDVKPRIVKSYDGGFYRRLKEPGDPVFRGDVIGEVIDPCEGFVKSQIVSQTDGIIFFAHTSPTVMSNQVVYKIIRRMHE